MAFSNRDIVDEIGWRRVHVALRGLCSFDQVVYLMLKQCLAHIEDGVCLLPEQKFKRIRVLPSLLVVLDESRQSAKASGIRAIEKKGMEAVRATPVE